MLVLNVEKYSFIGLKIKETANEFYISDQIIKSKYLKINKKHIKKSYIESDVFTILKIWSKLKLENIFEYSLEKFKNKRLFMVDREILKLISESANIHGM